MIEPQGNLRRRRVVRLEEMNRNNPEPPQPMAPNLERTPRRRERVSPSDSSPGMLHIKLSHWYCVISTILAIIAIIAATPNFLEFKPGNPTVVTTVKIERDLRTKADSDSRALMQSIQQWWTSHSKLKESVQTESDTLEHVSFRSLSWIKPQQNKKENDLSSKTISKTNKYFSWIDPTLLEPSSRTVVDIVRKIMQSSTRLLVIANFFLTLTYLVHSFIASWFLGPLQRQDSQQQQQQQQQSHNRTNQQGLVVDWSTSAAARERMGGFIVFKLLLISAVVVPDTPSLLIFVSWFTILSCMRSLDHLAHATTTHLSALGHPPRSAVLQLLLLVLLCDIVVAACCVALFHAKGWGIVLLLTSDCALLAADILSHILKHISAVVEDRHSQIIQSLEARQLQMHGNLQQREEVEEAEAGIDNENRTIENARPTSPFEIQEESRRLDLQMEVLDLANTRRLSILDTAMFALEVLSHLLTIAHFCHIWSLHGLQFTLIDGVLALHLHSAISSTCKKCAQRRNTHSILRDLESVFPNATDQELTKASVAGDVCCICLNTMSTGGHVKKVCCGHLYHTHCLREVVERAQSLEAAKCPLCRASILHGSHAREGIRIATRNTPQPPQPVGDLGTNNPVPVPPPPPPQPVGGERALFQFSTEELFPSWLPIPAFSFEVVRRQSAQTQVTPPSPPPVPPAPQPPTEQQDESEANGTELGDQQEQQQSESPPSFFRRLLVLMGAIPMSPEEEAHALAQLVDVFPQFDRSDLLRELRARGSAEAVAEAVLMGVFSGVARGE